MARYALGRLCPGQEKAPLNAHMHTLQSQAQTGGLPWPGECAAKIQRTAAGFLRLPHSRGSYVQILVNLGLVFSMRALHSDSVRSRIDPRTIKRRSMEVAGHCAS